MDKLLGTKRLASMPDRITNTINLHNGGLAFRPSALNAYNGEPLSSLDLWWFQWKKFMFHTEVQVFTGAADSAADPQVVCSLITPILRGKYPAITEEEQAISVPLQILCLAILDAVFIHILNTVSPDAWQGIRHSLCEALIFGKAPKVCNILAQSYSAFDVIFLQEAAAVFVQHARAHPDLHAQFFVLAPRVLDGKRDQNSLILASRRRFREESGEDVTQRVLDGLGGAWAAPGDLLVSSVEDRRAGGRWLLASFHGDSNGLSAQPLVLALCDAAAVEFGDHALLAGLDANTVSAAEEGCRHQSVPGFAQCLRGQGLLSVWGPDPDPAAWTSFSSRTFMQTQLHKAVPYRDRFARAQRSLKDWIVASEREVSLL